MEDTINKSFKNWLAQDVEEVFGISRTKKSDLLDRWLNANPTLTEYQTITMERLRADAEDNIDAWNEHALKFFFIGPLVTLIDFNEDDFHGFLEQTLTVSTDQVTARGNVGFMVAAGREKARSPFYLLHEYKPEQIGRASCRER